MQIESVYLRVSLLVLYVLKKFATIQRTKLEKEVSKASSFFFRT